MVPEYELKDAGRGIALFSFTLSKYSSRLTYIPEDGILHSHHRENLKSYIQNHVDIISLGFLLFLGYNEIACIVMHITHPLSKIGPILYQFKYQNLVDIIIRLHRARRQSVQKIKIRRK
jgi:hypothetical protein